MSGDTPADERPAMRARYAPCPRCDADDPEKVGFTWWGGLLGPSLLTHVRCQECGTAYNGKTGKSNDTAIAVYFGISLAVGLVLGAFALFAMNR